ncbi:MAG: DNA cytosine methyltransferase [Candidatus Cloacimonadota bacterium]|nr:MAG: DNA cytosine methyltransferase [Candidatus Cloacimonadota bacterium]
MKVKVLNLFSGVGGNRKLWKNVEVVAVENNPKIADIYKDFFPNDTIISRDAHSFLLEHFKEFDFIWSSPPCQTHASFRHNLCVKFRGSKPKYPDMRLYQEILFLKHNFKGKWVVENVKPYYKPLIRGQLLQRHLFWCNFPIIQKEFEDSGLRNLHKIEQLQKLHGIDLSKYKLPNKRQILRNCVSPEVGLHVFECALHEKQLQFDGVTVSSKC